VELTDFSQNFVDPLAGKFANPNDAASIEKLALELLQDKRYQPRDPTMSIVSCTAMMP
jgi:hypothetical protein